MILSSTPKKRVSVSWKTETHLLLVPDTWEKFTDLITSTFDIKQDFQVLTKNGAVVSSVELTR